MAEWLGHLMVGWPTWAVIVGIIVICTVGVVVLLEFGGHGQDVLGPMIEKRRRDVKNKTK